LHWRWRHYCPLTCRYLLTVGTALCPRRLLGEIINKAQCSMQPSA
jgi:hypothetical protein